MTDDELRYTPATDTESAKSDNGKAVSPGRRFLITFLWAFPIFMAFVLGFTPREDLAMGVLGSAIWAALCGLIGMLIPSQNKSVFVTISVASGLVGALIIGTMATS